MSLISMMRMLQTAPVPDSREDIDCPAYEPVHMGRFTGSKYRKPLP
jgi:hypothetical protein